ncbi:EAL domain-containing response regulator [Alteromonas sp. CYL-A6]|uniref:EAL domain-containing response regulator n=1 Tax=Alteromonas nitratireducens TaxID=3390813 RepID=UPI0034C41465
MSDIVIIEDAPDVGETLCDFARAAGFSATYFTEFDQNALSACQSASFVLLDLNMPGHDGLDVLDAFSHAGINVPVVLCSGVAESIINSAVDVLHELGLVYGGKLLKPFTFDQFIDVLNTQQPLAAATSSSDSGQESISLTSGDLSIAIKRDWFYPVFQPQVNSFDNTLVGVECLARLSHPLFGDLCPAVFIPRLVELGLMDEFTTKIIDTCLAQLASIGYPAHCRVSFNVDPTSLHRSFMSGLLAHVSGHYVQPSQICFEITELSAVGMTKELKSMLAKLRLNGLHISLDDFGTGFSTVHELDQLPFSELKIDRSFVVNMTERSGALAIVKHTIALANDLNMLVVAEGIETEEQVRLLQSLGCECMQGFYFARPMTSDNLERFIGATSQKEA